MSCIGVVGVGDYVYCVGVVDILVLGGVFVVEVVVGCVVRLVLWCVRRRGYCLWCFSLKLVETNGLSVGGFPFGMVIWAEFYPFGTSFLGKMVGADMLMDVVVEVFVVETLDVV